jgi:N-acetylmuramoyl-L-alanine amidase
LVTASFTGTLVKLTGKKGPQYGKAKVTLDGGEAEYVDLYSPYSVHQQFIYQKQGLDDAAHTLVIEWTGQKNAYSTGYYISLDLLLIQGRLDQAPRPTRFQQSDPKLTYVGKWGTSATGSPSGGSFAYANSAGGATSIKFQGTYLVWIAKTGPQYGKARVALDGGEAIYLDLYSPGSLYQQKVYSTGLLEEGPHTLTIEWAGLKNTRASSYYIDLDAVDVMGTLLTAPTPPTPATQYQQSDPKLTYVGSWPTAFQSGASGGSFKYATDTGAVASVSFNGTSLELVGKKSPQYGKARVSLDGGEAEYVDFYDQYWTYQEIVYSTGELQQGEHTLTIEWTGEKNLASTGYLVNIDAILVRGVLVEPQALTWYQQDTGQSLYAGAWNVVEASSAHGGSFYYADSPGASVTVGFRGTHLEWFSKTSPAYGKAWVSLDGGQAELVDLYSPDTLYRQCVYSTGPLKAGDHSLRISYSGLKNLAALGCAVGVDSFCTFGSLRVVLPAQTGGDLCPFALSGADKTRIAYSLPQAPASVQTGSTSDGGLWVDYKGAGGAMAPLTVGSREVRSVAATAVGGTAVRLTFDLAMYQRYRVMSLPASDSSPARIVVDFYRRAQGPEGDGPPLVCLDPGHGGSAPGTSGVVSKVPEKQMALAVGRLAAEYLRVRGLDVLMTRETDIDLTLEQRCVLANTAQANLFISIHGNAFYDAKVGGTETFYQEKTPDYTVAAKELATAVQTRVLQALGLKDRGARTYYVGTLGVLNGTVMPAVLVELGFMSNPTEDALLTSSAGQDKAAKAIADAVCDYLGWSTTVYSTEG